MAKKVSSYFSTRQSVDYKFLTAVFQVFTIYFLKTIMKKKKMQKVLAKSWP